MDSFRAEYGNIHFFFGDEDEYYTESLLKLNLKQYLNYCLRRDGYTGIFFIQPDSVEMGNAQSAEEYYQADPDKVLRMLKQKTVYKAKENVMVSGKKIGERYVIHNLPKENPVKRIHYMLKTRRSGNKYAFVIPLNLFCGMYGSPEMRRELSELLRLNHKNTVIILTSSMKADESFPFLTQNPYIFCSELFPEMAKILESNEDLRFYEEMKNELGERYHVMNQLREEDIRRLIQHIKVIEGKESVARQKRFQDYTAVLYAWYHSPEFGIEENLSLPSKSNHSLAELGKVLRQENGRVWTSLDALIDHLLEGQPPEKSLKAILTNQGLKEQVWHPMFAESSDVRRLRSAISGIASLNHAALSMRLWQVEQMLRCPWNHPVRAENMGISKMLKVLEEMQSKQVQSETTAVYVLEYLNYTIRNREKEESQTVFKMKCDCYEQRIRCSSRKAELEKAKAEHIRRRERHRMEFNETRRHLEQLRKQDPLYDELIRQMMEGSVDASFVALHAPEVNQDKGELIRLDKAIKNETSFINKNQEDINFYITGINNLETALTELIYEKNPGVLNDVLQRANEMLRTQGEREEKTTGDLWKTSDKMQETFEKLQKPTEDYTDSDNIFAELMGYSKSQKRELTYEI